jgi:hypothetical protein
MLTADSAGNSTSAPDRSLQRRLEERSTLPPLADHPMATRRCFLVRYSSHRAAGFLLPAKQFDLSEQHADQL